MERRRKKKSEEKLFFEELCNKYYIKILRYCNAHLGYKHEDLAEECAQDTFLTALQNINKLKVHPNVCRWLYKTAENYNKKALQKMKREKEKHVSIDFNVENELRNI